MITSEITTRAGGEIVLGNVPIDRGETREINKLDILSIGAYSSSVFYMYALEDLPNAQTRIKCKSDPVC